MAGCDACDANVRAELESKDPEEITEEERQILEGESETPLFYGPLAPTDIAYCEFCHAIGQVGAVFFGFLAFWIATSLTEIGIGLIVGGLIWLSLTVVVGYVGRFPILGALFGPIVEKILAVQFGVFVTKSAQKKYGSPPSERPPVVEYRMKTDGPEVHLTASPWALEQCAEMSAQGALQRVVIEDGHIVDIHPWNPDTNRFSNIINDVGFGQYKNVCEAYSNLDGPVTTLEFQELLQSQGERGISSQ